MAATGTINIIAELLGLGKGADFIDRFSLTETPAAKMENYVQQAAADAEEAIDLGGVSTVDLIIIKAVTNDMTIDTAFSSSYSAALSVPAGEIAVFKPAGTVYIKNVVAEEQVTYEYLIIGR